MPRTWSTRRRFERRLRPVCSAGGGSTSCTTTSASASPAVTRPWKTSPRRRSTGSSP
jgi:hypothetical protein